MSEARDLYYSEVMSEERSIVFADMYITQLEQQNEQMLEALIMIYKVWHEDSILISSVKSVIEKATGLTIEEILNEN